MKAIAKTITEYNKEQTNDIRKVRRYNGIIKT